MIIFQLVVGLNGDEILNQHVIGNLIFVGVDTLTIDCWILFIWLFSRSWISRYYVFCKFKYSLIKNLTYFWSLDQIETQTQFNSWRGCSIFQVQIKECGLNILMFKSSKISESKSFEFYWPCCYINNVPCDDGRIRWHELKMWHRQV